MCDRVVMVFGEGPHEMGRECKQCLTRDDGLPALPRLIDRLLNCPDGIGYKCYSFQKVRHVHRGRLGSGLAKKVINAIMQAARDGCTAAVIVQDRDRNRNTDKIVQLHDGRERAESMPDFVPTAVGTPVETFDAWMISDAKAMRLAGDGEETPHPNPEGLDGKEGTGNHPKEFAAQQFDGHGGRAAKYATVAAHVDLAHLERVCKEGFAPFSKEVRSRLGEALEIDPQTLR